jgi:tetratricopeptide (TPR) repeat protein
MEMFNDDDSNNGFDPDILLAVERFEEMVKKHEHYFFEADELEEIFEYYYQHGQLEQAAQVADFGVLQNPYSASFFVKQAHLDVSRGQFEAALDKLNQAEIFEPTNFELYLLRGNIYDLTGNPKEAVKNLKIAEGFAEDQVDVVYNALASVFINWKKYNSAIYYLQLVLSLNPEAEEVLYDISFCYFQLDDLDSGITFFQAQIDRNPYSDIAWYNLAICYNKLELFEKALEAFEYALLINDKSSLAWFNKANTWINLEQYQEALDCMYKAMDLEPDNAVVLTGLAVCLEKLERIDEALSWYSRALEADSLLSDAWYGLGVCYELQGNYTESLIHLRKACELSPDSEEYWFSLAECLERSGMPEEAIDRYQQALSVDPSYFEARVQLIRLYFKQGQEASARTLFAEGQQLHSEEADFYYRSAAVFLDQKIEQEALIQLQEALHLDPEAYASFFVYAPDALDNERVMKIIEHYHKA